LDHADVAEIALAEIEASEIPHHQRETLGRRLVEAELLFQALDEVGIKPLCAAIFRAHRVGRRAGGSAARAEIALTTRDAGGAAGIGTGELRDHALNRSARRELDDDERDEENSEQSRNHQQNAAGDIGAHELFRLLQLGGLRSVIPPILGRADALRIFRRLFRMAELVPISDRVRGTVPFWHPIAPRAEHAIERTADRADVRAALA